MSKIALTPNASGTGIFTIASPNSNTDRTLTLPDEAGTVLTSASTGTILQVKQTVDTTASAPSPSAGWNDLGTLSASITPSSASSKILLSCQIGSLDHSANTFIVFFRYNKDGSALGVGTASGSQTECTTAIRGTGSGDTNAMSTVTIPAYLDTAGTTSAITYKVQYNNYNGGAFYYLRSLSDDTAAHGRVIATLTLMEIAG